MAKKKKKSKPMGWRGRVLLIFMLLAAIAVMPTTCMLMIGMIPSMVAVFIDRTKEKTRALSVGAMNFAGCSPFVLQLWTSENTFDQAMGIVADPRTIIVAYSAAGVGYILDWGISGLIGTVMIQRATSRREQITKRHEELVQRWGREVSGEIPVDRQGFAMAQDDGPAK